MFYNILISPVFTVYGIAHNIIPNTFGPINNLSTTGLLPIPETITKDVLKETSFSVLELMKILPDMYSFLTELGIEPDLCQGHISTILEQHYSSPDHGVQHQKSAMTIDCSIHDIKDEHRKHLRNMYKDIPGIDFALDFGLTTPHMHFHIKVDGQIFKEKTSVHIDEIPAIIDDINGKYYYVLYPSNYIWEAANQMMILYCLGMLSRYHPHLWMKAIENKRLAEITDLLLNIIYRKFPNLILDQMLETQYYMHR